jgi:hypothetical protein
VHTCTSAVLSTVCQYIGAMHWGNALDLSASWQTGQAASARQGQEWWRYIFSSCLPFNSGIFPFGPCRRTSVVATQCKGYTTMHP